MPIYWAASDGAAPHPPAPAATPAPRTARSVEAIIASYDWPVAEALAIAWCESRLEPRAYNRSSGASGLFQVVPYWHAWRMAPGESLFDPEVNVRIAHEIYLAWGRSWRAWECRP